MGLLRRNKNANKPTAGTNVNGRIVGDKPNRRPDRVAQTLKAHKKIVLIALTAVVLLGAIGGVAWYVFVRDEGDQGPTELLPLPEPEAKGTIRVYPLPPKDAKSKNPKPKLPGTG